MRGKNKSKSEGEESQFILWAMGLEKNFDHVQPSRLGRKHLSKQVKAACCCAAN